MVGVWSNHKLQVRRLTCVLFFDKMEVTHLQSVFFKLFKGGYSPLKIGRDIKLDWKIQLAETVIQPSESTIQLISMF